MFLKNLLKRYSIIPDGDSIFGSLIKVRRGKYRGVIARIETVFVRDGHFNFSFEVLCNPKGHNVVKMKEYFAEKIVKDIVLSRKVNFRSVNDSQ